MCVRVVCACVCVSVRMCRCVCVCVRVHVCVCTSVGTTFYQVSSISLFFTTAQQFALLQAAKETLTDQDKRHQYDCWRGSGLAMSYHEWCAKKDSVKTVRVCLELNVNTKSTRCLCEHAVSKPNILPTRPNIRFCYSQCTGLPRRRRNP